MHSPAHMSAFAVYHWALLLLEVCVALCAGLALNAACARALAGGPPDRYDNPRYVSRLGVCLAARSQWKPSCESRHTPQGRPARLVVFECHYVTRVAMKHRKIFGALTGFIVDLLLAVYVCFPCAQLEPQAFAAVPSGRLPGALRALLRQLARGSRR